MKVSKISLLSILLVLVMRTPFVLAFDKSTIKTACKKEWGSDFERIASCIDEQNEAGWHYDTLYKDALSDPSREILPSCTREWDTNYEMVK